MVTYVCILRRVWVGVDAKRIVIISLEMTTDTPKE